VSTENDLPPEVPIPPAVKLDPPAPKESVDNKHVEAALAFLKVGAPLQDGIPADPNAELAKLRKSAK
jgi:hypothetical protein